jgi:2-phospho-L-lactate/phosphoenolpyruvate guanylyltransferase
MTPSTAPDACRTSQPQDTLCALVAIKSRERCKSRLAGALAPAARLALVRSLLAGVLSACREARSVERVLVVSPERDAVPAETAVLCDSGESLNVALTDACAALGQLGCAEALILPADLPQVTGAEIDRLVALGRETGFAIAPDAAQLGTNALYLRAGACLPLFRFQFGEDSLRRHLQEAARLRLEARVVCLPGLAFDVDAPEDLARLAASRYARRGADVRAGADGRVDDRRVRHG